MKEDICLPVIIANGIVSIYFAKYLVAMIINLCPFEEEGWI